MNREIDRIISYYWYYYPINSRGQFRKSRFPINPASILGEPAHHNPGLIHGHVPEMKTPIQMKYEELISKGFVGNPITPELPTSDGVGRFRHYRNGGGEWSIYWYPRIGAHEVHGAIRDKWASLGWERFGYPITDELTTPDGRGRVNHFRTLDFPGKPTISIYWTSETGAHYIVGKIRDLWLQLGGVKSSLGYPITDELSRRSVIQPVGDGTWYDLFQRFENGTIILPHGADPYVEQPTTPPPPTTTPSHTPPPTTNGYSKALIYNCHTDGRSIIIWVNDGSGFKQVTTKEAQYNDYGYCPVGDPYVLELKNGIWHNIVCVDVEGIVCGVNNPNQVGCQRYQIPLLGNSNGPVIPITVT